MTQDIAITAASVAGQKNPGQEQVSGVSDKMLATERNAQALLPFGLFLVTFVGSGLWLTLEGVDKAFYKYPPTVCILPAILLAVFLGRKNLNQTIEEFIRGAGDSSVVAMCMIFLLSGAFAAVARSSGGIDAVVFLGLKLIPSWLLTPGFFLISAFIATAMGTSMGTSAAVAPVALGVAEAAGVPLAVMGGAVMSGSMFGDNLSVISDTTIAATRTQGCDVKDKFRENLKPALIAAGLCFILYAFYGGEAAFRAPTFRAPEGGSWFRALPYLAILGLAVSGVNVYLVLVSGIISAAMMGFLSSENWRLSSIISDIYNGFQAGQEIYLLSMMVGGLGRLMERQGGLAFITHGISWFLSKKQGRSGKLPSRLGAGCGLAALVGFTNLCTANNTVAIIIAGKAAREISRANGINAGKSASILDMYSCVVQGLIPYGAQALLLGAAFSVSPTEIVTSSYYPMILAFSGLAFFLLRNEQPPEVKSSTPGPCGLSKRAEK